MLITTQELVIRYVAVWNESDANLRRLAIRDLWVPDGAHYVSAREVRGYLALEERVAASYEKNVRAAGYKFIAIKYPQTLHDTVTFNWRMADPRTKEVLAVGLEFLHVNLDGRIISDYQYIL